MQQYCFFNDRVNYASLLWFRLSLCLFFAVVLLGKKVPLCFSLCYLDCLVRVLAIRPGPPLRWLP